MPIRTVDVNDPAPAKRTQKLQRVVIQDDGSIAAHWVIQKKDGTRDQVSVEVSASTTANITARPAFQKLLDDIRDDTFSRTGGTQ
jgi:DNA invertase Pin-like site-specific DNA recombinase